MKPEAIEFIITAACVFAGLVWIGFRVSSGHEPSGRNDWPPDGGASG